MASRNKRSLETSLDSDSFDSGTKRSCQISRAKAHDGKKSGREDPEPSSLSFLESMDGALFKEIASFVVPIRVPTASTPRAIYHNVTTTRRDNSIIYVNNARRLWSTFGTLSKTLQKRTKELFFFDDGVISGIDADFYGVKSGNYFATCLFLANNKLPLTKLRVYTNKTSMNIVSMLLNECDTSKTKEVEVKIDRFDLHYAIVPYKKKEKTQWDGVIDLTNDDDFPSMRKKEYGPALKKYIDHRGIMSNHGLHREIALSCPSIRKLKINAFAQEKTIHPLLSEEEHMGLHHKHVNMDGAITRLRNLRHLEISISGPPSRRKASNGAQLIRSFVRCAENVQGLESLNLSTTNTFVYGVKVCIQSQTLRVIDVSGCHKGFWVEKCLCPSLERFKCRGGGYGNGVRECKPDGIHLNELRYAHGTFQAGSKKFYGMHVPDSCSVELR